MSTSVRSPAAPARRPQEAGFTLIELLVVLAILALLAGFAGPRVLGYLGSAKAQSARIQLQNVASAMDLFLLDYGRYPTADEGVKALIERPAAGGEKWKGPYLSKKDAILDPWGELYRYRRPGRNGPFEVFSLGADKAEGGEGEDADIYAGS
jgi:general secretion pathway protein G